MKNSYEIRGDVTAVFLARTSGPMLETLVDTADLDILLNFPGRFCATQCGARLYVRGSKFIGRKRVQDIRLHRLIVGTPDDMLVDHENFDGLDNRRSNLRVVTNQANMLNRPGAQRNSVTGIRGVSWDAGHKRWRVQIKLNGRPILLGRFTSLDESERVARAAQADALDRVLETGNPLPSQVSLHNGTPLHRSTESEGAHQGASHLRALRRPVVEASR